MSRSFESLRLNACVHRLDLGLYSHPKELSGNGVRSHVNSKGNSLTRGGGGSNPRRCVTEDSEPNTPAAERFWPLSVGLGTGTDNRTSIFTGISPQNRYFAPAYRSTQFCSDLPLSLSLSLSSYINGHSQEFDFYARFRGFLVALPRAYWQER